MDALGDYIDSKFLAPEGTPLTSVNPARGGEAVLKTAVSPARIALACEAAAQAARGWSRLDRAARLDALARFRAAIAARVDALAEAISLETGKILSEARAEVQGLIGRFELVRAQIERDLTDRAIAGRPGETLRHHALGVVGVIGPFNFPLHLCHAHVVPALAMGNTVVIKPSEVSPLAAQRYAECAAAAELPAGVFNLVQGTGDAGAALAAHRAVRGLCFTGSYQIGRKIAEGALDRPELLVALEMGGKNAVVLCEDVDIHQAAHEIVLGGYLTTGQRCTATERVLVHKSRASALLDALRPLVESLRFGSPDDPKSFAGPMATAAGRARFAHALAAARAGGAEPVVVGDGFAGDRFFAAASIHLLPAGVHHIAGYTDEELFGPDIAVGVFGDDDEAIAVLNGSAYGLANSVFTGDDARFERYYRETHSGILNRNRSTNLASPQLPFGGIGQSGNYRPAGSYAARNVSYPVAVQENVIGWGPIHPQLLDHMPPPDFERLEAQHLAEERAEGRRRLLDRPRPMRLSLPRGGALPQSAAWLRRLYAGDRVVEEKKPPVFDHLRSAGPWFVSIDEQPLSVLDGMSQTATSVGGFSESSVVQGFVTGAFGDTLVSTYDTAVEPGEPAAELATALRHLVPGLPHVTFTSSGAEANEKALALCRQHSSRPDADKVLVFDGCFHGRTLLTLHCTANPAKRKRFELAGYLATFAPFPVWSEPGDEEPRAPSGYYAMAGTGDVASLLGRFGDRSDDPLIAAEVQALAAVDRALRGGDHFAVVVEPMQAEGGDRYATARFFRALRLLTRHHDVPLVFDEVQTGFSLGGSFAWHLDFRLVNFRGQPDYPDAVTFAKRAQVGVVMSRFEDHEPTSAHPASLIRGRMHAEMLSTQHAAERIENLVKSRLTALGRAFPHLALRPRSKGYAFAFDLPTPDLLNAFIGQRFWRGAIVFAAGSVTARYRLSEGYLSREVDLLFEAIRRQLAWLDAHPGAQPPAWEDPAGVESTRRVLEHRIRNVPGVEAEYLLPSMLDIELAVYEPARRTPPDDIRTALRDPESIATIAEVKVEGEWRFAGFAIGWPLERAAQVEEGPDRDPMLGRHNTLYSLSLTVAPEFHDGGLGRDIKAAQLDEAARRKAADGRPRYRYVTGRNRIGHTPRMTHLNWVFGAHTVCVLTGQYEDPEGQAIYYRIPLLPIAPPRDDEAARVEAVPRARTHRVTGPIAVPSFDVSQGLARPFARPPASLIEAEQSGLLFGPAVNKLTLMNYVTPAVVRACEWIAALLPRLPHLYLTSSRDECVDKAIRAVKYHRPDGQIAIGFDGGYLGHTTAAARSLSDPAVHRGGPAHFRWPRVPHPVDVGVPASIAAIRAAVAAAGGPTKVLGLFYELCQERTGRVMPDAMWPALAALREELALPLVAVETASAYHRSAAGPFASSSLALTPDLLLWWGGGQTGYLHVSSAWRVGEPLTLVSTWDGDELTLIRDHHQLRAARLIDVARGASALDKAVSPARTAGLGVRGLGLYRVIDAGERSGLLADELRRRGVLVRRFPNGHLAIAPALDQAEDVAPRLGNALRELL